jgi:hexosaminidase
MQAPAASHVYAPADVRAVVDAAQARGIRVVPEFDVPGHATSWFAGYPGLATDCVLPPGASFTKPMDPTLNSTYDFLAALFAETGKAFPDAFAHVGGDEVEMACWQNSTAVAAFMQAHGIATFPQLQLYFEARVFAQLNATRRVVMWEGVSGEDNAYPQGAVVEVWKERAGDSSVLEKLARANYTLIFTTPDWYLDWSYTSATATDSHVNGPSEWLHYHAVDPLANTTLTPQQQQLLLGAEVCAWSPYTDATNIIPTIFPRASAAAERLWSAAGAAVDEPVALTDRMRAHRCRLVARNIAAAPIEWGGSCPNTGAQPYSPPYA